MNRHILVVEDQEDNRQILRDLLGSAGYELTEAENGERRSPPSASPLKADMRQPARHVRLVPEADILQRENVPTARAEAYYANWHEWSASEQN
jgi:CheY-like chemotaxis protein